MDKTRLLFSLAIVALLGAGCSRTAPASPPPAALPAPEIETAGLLEGTAVSLGPSGFNPAVLTVKKGATVIFINEDAGAGHWIASNPDPEHAEYPGFDAGGPIAPGGSYSFTFDRVGAWGYHDRLNPTLSGSIVVTD